MNLFLVMEYIIYNTQYIVQMNNLLSKLSENNNKAIKVSFYDRYGFHLINDNKGKHYIYLHEDTEIEDKLKFFSTFKNCFTITKRMSSNNILSACIEFKYDEDTFDIINRFSLHFIWTTLDGAFVTNYSSTTNMKKKEKRKKKKTNEKNYYKQFIKKDRGEYIQLLSKK